MGVNFNLTIFMMNNLDFDTLSVTHPAVHALWSQLYHDTHITRLAHECIARHTNYTDSYITWQKMSADARQDDDVLTAWLITLFNGLYGTAPMPTFLMHSDGEPEYFAPIDDAPARIAFAHGFFNSSLHEISHWCIAGRTRRHQNDFGYWYCPDGRSAHEQVLFEKVEIKPQAIECLFNLALSRQFTISVDNLNANFDTAASTFAYDVYQQASTYLHTPHTLPPDARRLIWIFLDIAHKWQ